MRRGPAALLALAVLAAAGASVGAEAPLALKAQKPLAAKMPALPRIAAPATPQTAKINAALARADARALAGRADCKSSAEGHFYYARTVAAPMRGAGFLSLYTVDDSDCGGAHPNTSQMALTYDLGTGAPINWSRYLPAALVGQQDLVDWGNGVKIGVVTTPALLAWYRKAALADMDGELKTDCADVMDDSVNSLILWIDAKRGGVAMQAADLPHVIAACGVDVVMPTAELRRRGAGPVLPKAIDDAHAARAWTDSF